MNSLKLSLFFLVLAVLGGCSTTGVNNDRAKALALASENSSGFLTIASSPLQYYCVHNEWPDKFKPNFQDKKLAMSVEHLQYMKNNMDYSAKFQLHSFVPGDTFSVDWIMTITPPKVDFKSAQIISVAIESDKYSIFIPFDYQFVCTDPLLVG